MSATKVQDESSLLVQSAEVEQHYVTVSWVAEYYGVSRLQVHRAIAAKRLVAARIQSAGRAGVVLDRRLLPKTFPR